MISPPAHTHTNVVLFLLVCGQGRFGLLDVVDVGLPEIQAKDLDETSLEELETDTVHSEGDDDN